MNKEKPTARAQMQSGSGLCAVACLLLCVVMEAVTGCYGHSAARSELTTAESLLEENPKQAVRMLDSLRDEAASWSKADRMRYELLWASARNKSYQPIGTDTTMLEVVEYYRRHGSANERMNAYYQLGCIYLDMSCYDLAGQTLYRAIAHADTLAADCDFRLLARIYGQLTQVYNHKTTPAAQLSIYPKAERYALLGKDTLMAVDIRKERARYYWNIENWDSAAILYEQCLEMYRLHNDTAFADETLKQLAGVYTYKKEYAKAAEYFAAYEKNQLTPDGELKHPTRHWNYWVLKAKYFIEQQDYASALPLLYVAKDFSDMDCRLSAFITLSNLYRDLGQMDSAYHYLKEHSRLKSEKSSSYSENTLLELQASFDIQRERERRLESEQYAHKLFLALCATCIIALISAGGYIIKVYYRRNVVLGKAMRNEYIRHKLEELKKQDATQAGQDEIRLLQEDSKDLMESSTPDEIVSIKIETLKASTICRKFASLYCAETATPTRDEWNDLQTEVGKEFPAVMELIKRHALQGNEKQVCLMLCAGIKPKEMSILIGCSKENISSIRRRLGTKIFGEECKAKDFDKKLLSYQTQQSKP